MIMANALRSRSFVEAGKDEVDAGLIIVERTQEQIRNRPKPVSREVSETLTGLVKSKPPKLIRDDLLANAVDSMQRGRSIVAGLAFIQLRQSFGHDRDWKGYIEARELDLDTVERLIGAVAFRNAMARCAKCAAQVRCPCQCGAPYRPETPWADEPESEPDLAMPAPKPPRVSPAFDRALAAIEADPSKSNRLIAKEIKVGETTVRDARERYVSERAVERAVERVGADGKSRRLPGTPKKGWQVLPPEGEGECDYSPEHDAAFPDLSAAERRRDASQFQAIEAQRMARDYALLEPGRGRDEITATRIKEARSASAAWKRVADTLAKAKRGG